MGRAALVCSVVRLAKRAMGLIALQGAFWRRGRRLLEPERWKCGGPRPRFNSNRACRFHRHFQCIGAAEPESPSRSRLLDRALSRNAGFVSTRLLIGIKTPRHPPWPPDELLGLQARGWRRDQAGHRMTLAAASHGRTRGASRPTSAGRRRRPARPWRCG